MSGSCEGGFRWLSRRTPQPDVLPKTNAALPVLRNNLAQDPCFGFLHNDIRSSSSSSSEEGSSCSRQSSVDSSTSSSTDSSTEHMSSAAVLGLLDAEDSLRVAGSGPKVKLMREGEAQLCRLQHSRTVVNKILGSKLLRRWESHRLLLTDTAIDSKTPTGYLEECVPYSQVEDVYALNSCDHKHCLSVDFINGALLIQVNNAYIRDQWIHSISWKRNMLKFKKLLTKTKRPEVFLKELKNLVDLTLATPLQDDSILNTPLDLVSELLQDSVSWMPKSANEEIVSVISPLLEVTQPTPEICDFLTQYCRENPRSRVVLELFTSIVQRILKHNMDFSKYPKTRMFVQSYLQALSYQNEGRKVLEKFISSVHGPTSNCPHPRMLPNLVSVCLAAVYALYEEKRNWTVEDRNDISVLNSDWETRLLAFLHILDIASAHEDWTPGVAQLMQPIPFPDDAIADSLFTKGVRGVLGRVSGDERCEVHACVLAVREEKEGWLQLVEPAAIACHDDGTLWAHMLSRLLSCCCRRRAFLSSLAKRSLGACVLLAVRGEAALQDTLAAMLELGALEPGEPQQQAALALQATPRGRARYDKLAAHMHHLSELQQKGGPRKLTLPSRSTDADVARLLSCGSFGNLECLSLAFSQVTSACADHLVKLPSLRYLNLWSTQFGDVGLRLISEHLPKLQVLNLCETPVTDKGLLSLTNMKSLRKLNLNSTSLSAQTFEKIKQKLPALQECDIRYTDAW